MGLLGLRIAVASATLTVTLLAQAGHPELGGIGLLKADDIAALAGSPDGDAPQAAPPAINIRRSLFVTDQAILSQFTFAEVLNAIGKFRPSQPVSAADLFDQWWDTANTAGQGLGLGPNCATTRFTFPYQCPRPEGQQVKDNRAPFTGVPANNYVPIALVNRFDLATLPREGGTDCGEYRMVFARNSGKTDGGLRNFVIFEGVLPNPRSNGNDLSGCKPVAQFWASLSQDPSQASRAKKLKNFYFTGLPGFKPVVSAAHYGNATPEAKGQIRSNQFLNFTPTTWMLREFRIDTASNPLLIVPATVKDSPDPLLFDETVVHPKGPSFREAFLQSVAGLSLKGVNFIHLGDDLGSFDSGESESSGPLSEDILTRFASSPRFRAAIKAKIDPATELTPEHIVARAQTQSCSGCHQLSNGQALGGTSGKWPPSLTFTHVSEQQQESSPDGGQRFVISEALTGTFLPRRKNVLSAFLTP